MFRLDPTQAALSHGARKTASGPTKLSSEAQEIVDAPIEPSFSSVVIVGVAQLIEALLLATLGFAVSASYIDASQSFIYIPTIGLATLFANVLFNAARTHRIISYRTVMQQTGRVLAAWAVTFITLMSLIFLLKGADLVSRVWLVGWFVSGCVVLVLFRLSLRALLLL